MNHCQRCALILTAALLAGCQPVQDTRFAGPPDPVPGVDACGAAELQDMVGAPKSILAVMKFAVPLRVIEPGMAVTADFSPDRLNFEIGSDGKITRIACY